MGPKVAGHGPWPRHMLDRAAWLELLRHLAQEDFPLLGLWGDTDTVHLALRDGASVAVASLSCGDRRYPAVSPVRPSAGRLERTTVRLKPDTTYVRTMVASGSRWWCRR